MSTSAGDGSQIAHEGHTTVALLVAGLATLASLGLRVEAGQIGRTSSVRVFLVAAIAMIAMAAAASATRHRAGAPQRARTLVLGAMTMLGTAIALIVGNAAPQGLIVLLIALAALVVVSRQQRRTR
jgi:hypothetical protein